MCVHTDEAKAETEIFKSNIMTAGEVLLMIVCLTLIFSIYYYAGKTMNDE